MPTDRNLIKREVGVYARVLLDAATKTSTVFETGIQLGQVRDAVRSSMELKDALHDTDVPSATREGIVRKLFSEFDPALVDMLAVMVSRGDMDLLPRVKDTYDQLSEEETGTVVVDVTTVVELTDDLRDQIKGKMSADLGGKKIVLSEHIDKSILGGVILGCHGKRLDGSARTQLEAARTIMTTAPGGE